MSSIRVGLILIAVLATSIVLGSCSALVGVGTTVGVAAVQERGVKGRATDLQIEALILKDFLARGLKMTTTIGVEVYDGRVLLTGLTKDTNVSDEAVRVAWKTRGVKKVINEIKLEKAGTIADFAHDTWITTKLKSRMTFDKNILAINYLVETVNRSVYLLGVAQDAEELKRVVGHASSIDRVREVVYDHVRIKGKAYDND